MWAMISNRCHDIERKERKGLCCQVAMSGLKISTTPLTFNAQKQFQDEKENKPQISRPTLTSHFLRFASISMENAFGQRECEDSLSSVDMTWRNPADLNLFLFFLWLSFWADLHRLQLILKIIVCESLALSSSSRSQSFTPCVSFAGPEGWRNLGARQTDFTADFLDHEKVWKRAATPQQDNEKSVAAAWLLCHRGVE